MLELHDRQHGLYWFRAVRFYQNQTVAVPTFHLVAVVPSVAHLLPFSVASRSSYAGIIYTQQQDNGRIGPPIFPGVFQWMLGHVIPRIYTCQPLPLLPIPVRMHSLQRCRNGVPFMGAYDIRLYFVLRQVVHVLSVAKIGVEKQCTYTSCTSISPRHFIPKSRSSARGWKRA